MATVSTGASLTEAQAKIEFLSRQLEGAQQQLDASEGLERDLQRLGREAEEMHRKADHSLEEKQVGMAPTAFLRLVGVPCVCFSSIIRPVVDGLSHQVIIIPLTVTDVATVSYR